MLNQSCPDLGIPNRINLTPSRSSELGIDPEALWQTADKLRGSIDAAEYKHVVLGLVFLKYAI
jgi:HsdM N-terminal domain